MEPESDSLKDTGNVSETEPGKAVVASKPLEAEVESTNGGDELLDSSSQHLDDYSCGQCSENISTNAELQEHNRYVHPGTSKDHKFNVCPQVFSTRQCLKVHASSAHLEETKFACELCGSKFTQNGNLKKHIQRVHLKIKEFECNVCLEKQPSHSQISCPWEAKESFMSNLRRVIWIQRLFESTH